ncbi:MAG: NUDIX hydrolase [Acidimicrobiales bacterium]
MSDDLTVHAHRRRPARSRASGAPYSRMIPAERGNDDAVVAFAVTGDRDDLSVLLIEQFRHATGRYHLEVPRGAAQPGMSLAQTAAAELSEETGYRANRVRLLGTTYTDTGILTQRMAIHLLTDLTYVGVVHEELELIRSVRAVPLDEVIRLAARGEITDGYLLQALAMFRAGSY